MRAKATYACLLSIRTLVVPAMIFIMASCIGHAPPKERELEAQNDTVATPRNTPIIIEVLTNDFFMSDESPTVLLVTLPDRGTVEVSPDNSIVYTPDDDFTGTDTFEYRVKVSDSLSNIATVEISVIGSE